MLNKFFLVVVVFSIYFTSVFSQSKYPLVGQWRGSFPLKDGTEIPFVFLISGISADAKLYFINGKEKNYAGVVKLIRDSFFVKIDQFDNELILGKSNETEFSGFLRKQNGKGTPIPIKAVKQKNIVRFITTGELPATNISGRYEAVFVNDSSGKRDQTVGLLEQKGKLLTATFLKITGDSRFLEGIVEGNRFYLSSFYGSSPSLYRGIIEPNGVLKIEQIGLKGNSHTITAQKNSKASLPNAYELTQLKNKNESFNFSFPNINGKNISPNDDKYVGKPLIVTMGGTWCPNCMDEAAFLSEWYKKNKSRGIEVITIQYETQIDTAHVKKAFTRFKNRFNIQYEQVLGGTTDNKMVMKSLPALDTFISFPTTLFIDRNRKVTKIHTGFSGPATGKFYTDFIKEFNETVDRLLMIPNN